MEDRYWILIIVIIVVIAGIYYNSDTIVHEEVVNVEKVDVYSVAGSYVKFANEDEAHKLLNNHKMRIEFAKLFKKRSACYAIGAQELFLDKTESLIAIDSGKVNISECENFLCTSKKLYVEPLRVHYAFNLCILGGSKDTQIYEYVNDHDNPFKYRETGQNEIDTPLLIHVKYNTFYDNKIVKGKSWTEVNDYLDNERAAQIFNLVKTLTGCKSYPCCYAGGDSRAAARSLPPAPPVTS